MKKSLLYLLSLIALSACNGKMISGDAPECDSDSIRAELAKNIPDTIGLPVKQFPSVGEITYKVTVFDSTCSGRLDDYRDPYLNTPGKFAFRANSMRDADFGGTVKGTPKEVVKVWQFNTEVDNTKTSVGSFGGGTGWTGQPLYVEWPDSLVQRFKKESPALTEDFSSREIIINSLCGRSYFLNFDTGKPTRKSLDVGNPVKGTATLHPALNGMMYVGQGLPCRPPMGQCAINLFKHERVFFQGNDSRAWRSWGANDSSPLVRGGFLFWPSENGTIYKYKIQSDGNITLHTTLQYRANNDGAAGVENSICIYKNLGFFGDNHGDVLCIDLDTMEPVWHYDNHDDIDGTIVCEVENDVPYLYCGCEVDRQGNTGMCHFVKLNGLDGSLVWENQIPCKKLNLGGKHFDGGLYCSPLIGHGDCEGMIFASICQRNNTSHAEFTAFDRKTGKILYQTPLNYFAWNSPVAFYNEKNKLFIFCGDSSGWGYLIDGKTGKIIFKQHLANNFESSPVVVGNQFVVGSRGVEIYKFEVR